MDASKVQLGAVISQDDKPNLQQKVTCLLVYKKLTAIFEVFHDYGNCLPSDTNEQQHPVNFYYVTNIIYNKQQYESPQLAKQAQIHMLAYGICRHIFNIWAIDTANDWIDNKTSNLQVSMMITIQLAIMLDIQENFFVYSNLMLRAGNSVSDRIHKCMLS